MRSTRTTIITDSPLCLVAGQQDKGAPLFIKRSRPRSGAGVIPTTGPRRTTHRFPTSRPGVKNVQAANLSEDLRRHSFA
jgi:hypothetical protein